MELATLSRTFFVSDGFGIEPKVYASKSGKKKTYAGVPVFRSGTFRDSYGDQSTYEDLHIQQMVSHYDYLVSRKILESVPARDGHPGFLVSGMQGKGNVVGWHDSVGAKTLKSPIDGTEYTYLLVDYTITEDYAQDRLDNGTWRNRSSEIGSYRTNDEAEFWPVYLGFAFVDFPAVEGLNFTSANGARCFVHSAGRIEERNVTDTTAGQAAAGAGAGSQTGGSALPFGVPGTPAAPFVFNMGGKTETDPIQVQSYINRLEGFFNEQRQATRAAFVNGLAAAGKISAAQIEETNNFAQGLNDDQYAQWSKVMDAAAQQPVFANHGVGPQNPNNAAQQPANVNADLENAEQIVKMHERSGMSADAVKKTSSYQKLVAAGKRPA